MQHLETLTLRQHRSINIISTRTEYLISFILWVEVTWTRYAEGLQLANIPATGIEEESFLFSQAEIVFSKLRNSMRSELFIDTYG